MSPTDFIIIGVIALIIGGACFYIYRSKKRGAKCIGCPYSKQCGSKECGCSSTAEDNK